MKTKELLNEWKNFLNESRIIPLSELVDIIRSSTVYSNNDVDQFTKFWNSNQFSSKYSQVIKNDLEKGEPIEHIVDAVISHYNKVYQSASPKVKSAIGSGAYSADDLRKDLDERLDSNKFNSRDIRQQCQYQNERPVVGKYKDFDVVYSESDWVVIEPKTISGSVAWAHGKPDGSEETDQNRRVGWCTATSSGNNMFPNYAGNLHMFYFIKSDYENVVGPERRLCLSYSVKEGKAELVSSEATVNANNRPINISYINKLITNSILTSIESLVSTRKETSFSEIYSKITVTQLVRQIAQMKKQEVNSRFIEDELSNYAKYAKSKDVVNYILSLEDIPKENIHIAISSRKDLLTIDPSGELIRQYANSENGNIREATASRIDLLEVDPSGELIRQLANDKEVYVRQALAKNEGLSELDNLENLELIKHLVNDKHKFVREALASREDLYTLGLTDELLEQLANDENEYTRACLAKQKNLQKLDSSSGINLLELLSKDKSSTVRYAIAFRQDLLELDPSGKLFKQLVNDKNASVRSAFAYRKDLKDLDTSGKLIKKLANDKNPNVRQALAHRTDLLELDPSGDLLKQLENDEENVRSALAYNPSISIDLITRLSKDKSIYIRKIIAEREDLLELDPSGNILKQLANDKDPDVLLSLAYRGDLLELDPSGEVVKKLANSKTSYIKQTILHDIKYYKFLKQKTNESVLKDYIKLLMS